MTQPLRVGQELEVEITGLALHGEGVAALGERELLVPGLFPGERARVRIEALARRRPLAHGRLRTLLEPSPDRREPPCMRNNRRD
ncbi:MAG: TRAM domain-containing protein, partial [Pseudomonadales bacterium]|nr:TRAM domain-containing protein [Pseudomonadales bacterium]